MQPQKSKKRVNVDPNLTGEQRFELIRQLADTLQGRIYSAIDKTNDSFVVVKETWKQLVKLKKSRDGHRVPEDFVQEKKIMTYLSTQPDCNPGFVRILDSWEDENCFFYAMEGCQGGELFEYVKSMHTRNEMVQYTQQNQNLVQEPLERPHKWEIVVRHMFRQLVECVSWMHHKGVCHLDLSLENTMIYDRENKIIKIIDFGLAMHFTDDFTNDKRVGKIGYMAPEVFAKKPYDSRKADIWSMGVMLFMMLIGAPPYEQPVPSNPAFACIINGDVKKILKHWKRLRHVTVDALDLLTQMLRLESDRISMEQLRKHPFVQLDQIPVANANIEVVAKESINQGSDKAIADNSNQNQQQLQQQLQQQQLQQQQLQQQQLQQQQLQQQQQNQIQQQQQSQIQQQRQNQVQQQQQSQTQQQGQNQNQNSEIQNSDNNSKHNSDRNVTNTENEQRLNNSQRTTNAEDMKNDTSSRKDADVNIKERIDIRNYAFQSHEAIDFRKYIFEINKELSINDWRNVANQIELAIEKKTRRQQELKQSKSSESKPSESKQELKQELKPQNTKQENDVNNERSEEPGGICSLFCCCSLQLSQYVSNSRKLQNSKAEETQLATALQELRLLQQYVATKAN